jgi:hypothetical protein
MHKDTPPYHPIHLPLNQEKYAIPIKEPKKKSGGGACLQYSPKTPAGVADVCICCVKKMKNVRMEMVCWMSSTHASPHYAAFGNKNL